MDRGVQSYDQFEFKGGGRGNAARLLTTAIAKKLVYEAWFHAVGNKTGGETLQPLNVLIVAAIKT